jgi:hypothetical protein
MAIEPQPDIRQLFLERTPIEKALNQAVREAVELHKRMGLPLATWRDGKVVWVTAEEVERERDEGAEY